MTRRYLFENEVASALRRGRSVEAFLGAFGQAVPPDIRWFGIRSEAERITCKIWISPDLGDADYLDIYEFGGDDDPAEIYSFRSLDECLEVLNGRFPGVTEKLVNEGVVQDEYADYLKVRDAAK